MTFRENGIELSIVAFVGGTSKTYHVSPVFTDPILTKSRMARPCCKDCDVDLSVQCTRKRVAI